MQGLEVENKDMTVCNCLICMQSRERWQSYCTRHCHGLDINRIEIFLFPKSFEVTAYISNIHLRYINPRIKVDITYYYSSQMDNLIFFYIALILYSYSSAEGTRVTTSIYFWVASMLNQKLFYISSWAAYPILLFFSAFLIQLV